MKIIKKCFLMLVISNFLAPLTYSMERERRFPGDVLDYYLRQDEKRKNVAKQGSNYFNFANYIRNLIRRGDLVELKKNCGKYKFNPDNSVNKLINSPDFLCKLCCKPLETENLDSVTSCLSYLVKQRKLNLYAQDNRGQNIFHLVVCMGKRNWVEILLQVDPKLLDSKHSRGKTALLWAAHFGKFEMAKLLLEQDANFNVYDNRGWNLFHVLFMSGDINEANKISFLESILDFLKENNSKQQVVEMLEKTDFKRKRPLYYTKQAKEKFGGILNSVLKN